MGGGSANHSQVTSEPFSVSWMSTLLCSEVPNLEYFPWKILKTHFSICIGSLPGNQKDLLITISKKIMGFEEKNLHYPIKTNIDFFVIMIKVVGSS